MKKYFSLISFLILSFVGFTQTQQNLGAPNTNVVVRGLMGIDTGFQYRTSYADTTAANLSQYLSSRAGMTIRTGNTLWIRNSDATRWLEFGSGSLNVDTTQTVRLSGTGSVDDPLVAHVQISQQQGNALDTLPDGIYVPSMIQNGIISGLRVIWETGLTYTVTAGTYAINGIVYNSPETSITLDNADPSLNRFDGFVATSSSTVIDLTGTPSDDPVNPSYDADTQIPITFVLVTAASTEPTYCRDSLYFPNNGETWTSVSGTGRIVVTSTTNPYSPTQDIEFTLARNNDQLRITKATVVNLGTYSVLVLKIRSKAQWATTSRLALRWYNGLTPLGIEVVIGDGIFSFNSSITNEYQTIVIPLTNFGSVTNPDNLLFTVRTNGNNTIGLYADNIELLGCDGAPIPTVGNFHAQGGNRWGTTSVIGTLDNYPYQVKTNNTNHSLFQVGGSIQLQGSTPRLSFLTNTGASSDYFIWRSGTDLITNTAGGYITRWTGNRVYSFDKNNGHLWADSLGTLRMRLAPTGALRLDAYGDNTFTGTATRWLAVDVDGNVIEEAPPISTPLANNGVSVSGTTVQLGGTGSQFTGNRTITTSAFSLTIPSSNSSRTLLVTNSSSGNAVEVTSTSGNGIDATGGSIGVFAESTNGIGVWGQSINNVGVVAQATNESAIGGQNSTHVYPVLTLTSSGATTNSVTEIFSLSKVSTGATANGFGAYYNISLEASDGAAYSSTQLASRWTDVTVGTRTSQFILRGINSAATADILTIDGDGTVTLGAAYQGLGAGYIAVSNTGQLTWSAGGGGGGGDALTSNPLSQFAATTSAQLAGVISNETGTNLLVFSDNATLNSPTFVTPVLGTPASGTLTNATGLPVSTGIAGLGTGVAAALAVNTGSAGAFVLFNGALGTPTSGTVSTGVTLGDVTMNVTGTDATGDMYYRDGSGILARIAIGTAGQFLRVNGSATGYEFATVAGSGTMTSATLTQPSQGITITNSGVAQTTVATWTVALANGLLNLENLATTGIMRRTGTDVFTAGTLVSLTTEVTGTLPVANGGTGQTTYTNGQLLIGNTSGNTLTKATLTAANGISITNGAGSITVSTVFVPTVQTLTDGATITFNVSLGGNSVVTLGGTGRTLNITNPVAGYTYIIRIIQGSGGSKTITTWPTGTRWPNGTSPTLSTTVGAVDIVTFYYDGTSYYAIFNQNFS